MILMCRKETSVLSINVEIILFDQHREASYPLLDGDDLLKNNN